MPFCLKFLVCVWWEKFEGFWWCHGKSPTHLKIMSHFLHHFPKVRVKNWKNKNIWNHHLVFYFFFGGGRRGLLARQETSKTRWPPPRWDTLRLIFCSSGDHKKPVWKGEGEEAKAKAHADKCTKNPGKWTVWTQKSPTIEKENRLNHPPPLWDSIS